MLESLNKNLSLKLCLATCLILAFSGCGSSYHYRAYLLKEDGTNTDPKSPSASFNNQVGNDIPIEKGLRVTVSIPEVRVGFTHRKMETYSGWGWDSKRGPYANEYTSEDGLGGRDYWLLTEIVGLDHNDPLGLRQTTILKATYVKRDQQSYGFLPLEESEQIILDTICNTSYQVTVKLYSVHGLDAKKLLYAAGNTTIAGTAWAALKGTVIATGNFLAKELFDSIEGKFTKDPHTVERLLLQANAELEFSGTLQLVLHMKPQNNKREYLLYDIVKSHLDRDSDGKLDVDAKATLSAKELAIPTDDSLRILPNSQDQYETMYRIIHSFGTFKVENPQQIADGLNAGKLTRDQLTRSYARINVSTISAVPAPAASTY